MTRLTDLKKRFAETVRHWLVLAVAGTAALCALPASAQVYLNGSVNGQLAPGVYGRVELGNAPAPALIYSQPMMIAPPPVAVARSPIYMYVPPGHAKHWDRHCSRYSACGQPVYFLRERPRYHAAPPPPHRRDRDHGRWKDRDHDRRHDRDDRRDQHRHGRD